MWWQSFICTLLAIQISVLALRFKVDYIQRSHCFPSWQEPRWNEMLVCKGYQIHRVIAEVKEGNISLALQQLYMNKIWTDMCCIIKPVQISSNHIKSQRNFAVIINLGYHICEFWAFHELASQLEYCWVVCLCPVPATASRSEQDRHYNGKPAGKTGSTFDL